MSGPVTLCDSTGKPISMTATNSALHTTIIQTSFGSVDHRLVRFDAPADMPASVTSSTDVTADLVQLDTFSSAARIIQLLWHGAGITGADTQATQAFFGEVAFGALVTVNATDDATAAARLTYTNITGGDTVSAGKTDVFMVSKSNPVVELTTDAAITDIYAIGVPNGLTTTHLDTILPCFLEVRVIG